MTDFSDFDIACMQAALAEAERAAAADEVPVGAVLTVGGEIVAQGNNRTLRDTDPTAHAEVVVLREAARRVGNHRIIDATLYVTLEPCVMCAGALIQARVERVVFAAWDRRFGALETRWQIGADGIGGNHRLTVQGGLLEAEARALLQGFFRARR